LLYRVKPQQWGVFGWDSEFSVLPGSVIQGAGTLTGAVATVTETATRTMIVTTTARAATSTGSASAASLAASSSRPPNNDVAIGTGVGVSLGLTVLALVFLLFRKRCSKGSSNDGAHQDLKLREGSYSELENQSEIDGGKSMRLAGRRGQGLSLNDCIHSYIQLCPRDA
jgi:hypothetical protein